MKENKKINMRRVILALEILIFITLISLTGFKVYNEFFKKDSEPTNKVTEKETIKKYGYKLEDRDTLIYQTNYKELEKVLKEKEINYEKYAEYLSKLFVIDFYTLSNKLTSTDIGSLDFIHPDNLENFKLNAGNTIYKTVLSNLYKERTQKLPEVSGITLDSITPTKFNYSEKEYDAYECKLTWTYIEDLGYDTTKTLILMKDENKLYVISAK